MSQEFRFSSRPVGCLIVKKSHDALITAECAQIAKFLVSTGVRAYCEWAARAELPDLEPIRFDLQDAHQRRRLIDFCVSVGGDGTILHLNSLFQFALSPPPLIAFARGTLGFLTPFDVHNHQALLQRVVNAHMEPLCVVNRTRLHCAVIRRSKVDGKENQMFAYQPLNEVRLYTRGLF